MLCIDRVVHRSPVKTCWIKHILTVLVLLQLLSMLSEQLLYNSVCHVTNHVTELHNYKYIAMHVCT